MKGNRDMGPAANRVVAATVFRRRRMPLLITDQQKGGVALTD
jgi:hypothetical protein